MAELLTAASGSASAQGLTAEDRVLSTRRWDTADELTENFLAVLATGASLVLVANPDAALLDRRRDVEKVTHCLVD